MTWREAVLEALRRYSLRHATRSIQRQGLVAEELARIVADVGSTGATPWQTMSRILQELRRDGIIHFLGSGDYLLADSPISVESEELTDEVLDFAVDRNLLEIGVLPTGDAHVLTRRRRGQDRVHRAALANYGHRCALCDVEDAVLLVAGHIARWADHVEGRGDLTNVICMCRFHDALFETGYFSIAADYGIVKRQFVASQFVGALLSQTTSFRPPTRYAPGAYYLTRHAARFGF